MAKPSPEPSERETAPFGGVDQIICGDVLEVLAKIPRESVHLIVTSPPYSIALNYIKNEGTRDCNVQRYKGLGEMNAGQLWETTMDSDKRTMLRVELRDLVESDEIFSTLMGENVENRRRFLEENALDVRNLDV